MLYLIAKYLHFHNTVLLRVNKGFQLMMHIKDPGRGFVVYNVSYQSDLPETFCENTHYRNLKNISIPYRFGSS